MSPQNAAPKLSLVALRRACSDCSLQELCLPLGVPAQELGKLESLVETVGPLQPRQHLFREHDGFTSLYVVRSGCVKTYATRVDGSERVLGFHLPGELVGLDAIHSHRHRCSAVTLDTAMACRLPFARLSKISQEVEGLQRQLFRLMSGHIDTLNALSSDLSIEQRVAAFLLGFGDRMKTRGFSRSMFRLPMSRYDIASYLRLAPETVSRTLTSFAAQGLIEVSRREVSITDRAGLERLCPPDLRL